MSSVLFIAGWVAGWLLLWRLPRLEHVTNKSNRANQSSTAHPVIHAATDPRNVSVIIPARNEAANIKRLVASLRAQRPGPAEIVVVDDDSVDDTPLEASRAGARVIHPGCRPPGWTGKAWACHRGAAETNAPVLMFIDADVEFRPGALQALLGECTPGRLTSVAPWHLVRRPYEWLSLLFNIVAVMGTGAATLRRRHIRGAFGPVIVLRRADYERLGGHAAVRAEVADDLALASRAHEAGLELEVLGGGRLISYRMYPDGLRSLREGWVKNIAVGAATTPPLRLVGVIAWIASGLTAVAAAAGNGGLWWLGAACWSVQLGVFARRVGSFPPPAWLLFPVQLAWFLVVFSWSVVRVIVFGSVRWRGRTIPVRRTIWITPIAKHP
ncbi:MAG: glycosyltransferase [Acidimicrobiales bacterium]|nr:glycosyltransferase [Acidimicrobiales bacterium]